VALSHLDCEPPEGQFGTTGASGPARGDLAPAIRRNTALLAANLAVIWSVTQLAAALGAITLSEITGRDAVAGAAPAIFVSSWAAAALFMGRFMDHHGRRLGLLLGFAVAFAGAVMTFAGTRSSLLVPFLVGMAVLGAGLGSVGLARAGAADMYPPERRARGISLVLMGAAVGAILSPIAFARLVRGAGHDPAMLARTWLIAAAILAVGAALAFAIHPDPMEIGKRLGLKDAGRSTESSQSPRTARPMRALLELAPVRVALVAAIVSQTVMTSLMTVMGKAMVDHGHDPAAVFVSLSVHFLGMFGLVLVVGQMVDRIGRERSIVLGLVVLAAGAFTVLWGVELTTVLPAMFAIGIGWNISFVGATAMMADATQPEERASLLGFSDFAALGCAAIGAVLAGGILGLAGLVPLAVAGGALSMTPLVGVVLRRRAAAA
jgi:MFS family permease